LKLGIFGGTFNPIHLGHLLIAQDALETFGLSRVLFLPSARPPHKTPGYLADANHRLAMVRLAIRDNSGFFASDMEIRRGGKSYTIDTVRALQHQYPRTGLYLVIGSDSLNDLHNWREATQLIRLCKIIAVQRPGEKEFRFNRKRLRGFQPLKLSAHPFEISSSEIRERFRRKKSNRYLLPEAVARYVAKHKLYRRRG